MKYLFIFLVFATPIVANDLLDKAATAYDSRNYKEAIALYNQLIKEGNSSFELYYNLGNAHYRNKEIGYAIYNYELARKLNPNDQDVQINLGIASSKTIDNIDAKENFFINAIKSNIVHSFTTNTWALFSILLAFVTCLLFFLFVSSYNSIIKKIAFFFSITSFIILIVVYFLGKSALNSKKENKFAIILNKEVKINNEPNTSAILKFALHEGTKVRIVEVNGDWVLIKLENGNEGWIKQSEIGII